ncbi:MAG: hypothetical protein LBQ35_09810 [Spirochaetaceae bacterium]|nr:hypothetical protein [Spirochaetaceae bacterium]
MKRTFKVWRSIALAALFGFALAGCGDGAGGPGVDPIEPDPPDPPGATWTAVSDSAFGDSSIRGIAWGGDRFVAVGEDGKIAYSNALTP